MGMVVYSKLKKPKPGDNIDSAWGNSVVAAINSITPVSGANVRLKRTQHGSIIESTAKTGKTSVQRTGDNFVPVPCKITGGDALNGYDVEVYENGLLLDPTGTATLFVMQFNTNTDIPTGTVVMAYTTRAMVVGGTEQAGD